MEVQRTDEQTRLRRERAKQAINAAMESRWADAVAANRLVLESDPNDVEAWNRLGKAESELGHYDRAREAFAKALAISPNNTIAKKNLERLGLLRAGARGRAQHARVPPQFFIEETGKTGIISLVETAPKEALARVSAGEPVRLEPADHRLVVKNADGEVLGTVEPKVGLRLLGFMRGGNKYAAAVISIDANGVKVFVRETHQHVSQRGRLSFAPRGLEGFRPYVWKGAYHVGQDEDEDAPQGRAEEWDETGDEEPHDRRGPRRPVHAGADDEDDY